MKYEVRGEGFGQVPDSPSVKSSVVKIGLRYM